jgi:hypothetical protein
MNYMDRYPVLKRGIYWFWESWTIKDGVIPIPDKVMKKLNWDEKTLLEFEYVENGKENGPGWVIKQSKVAASKFLGFNYDENMDKT